MPGKIKLVPLLAVFALLFIGAGVVVLCFYLYAVSSGPISSQEMERVYLPPGSSFAHIERVLQEADVIVDDRRFGLLARYLGVSRQLKAGEYIFARGASPLEVLKELAVGKTVLREFTVPEGSNIFQVADILASQGWVERQNFLDLVQSSEFSQTMGLTHASLEGYLFPDTYHFPKGEDVKNIIGAMVARMRQVIAEECQQGDLVAFTFQCSEGTTLVDSLSKKRLLGVFEILTIASIVEKETGVAKERPLVAGVFLNRLLSNMRLQADPTVVYGLQKFGVPLSKKDLQTPGPYNTYLNRGLPKGPISSPGRAAITSVLQASLAYYYFVAQGDGSHYFSKNLKEHNRAVRRYRKVVRKKVGEGAR